MAQSNIELPEENGTFLESMKVQVRSARLQAVRTVNTELIRLYWALGRAILDRQEQQGWGAKVIDRLAADLRAEFPDMKGLSRRNLHYMKAFASGWRSTERSCSTSWTTHRPGKWCRRSSSTASHTPTRILARSPTGWPPLGIGDPAEALGTPPCGTPPETPKNVTVRSLASRTKTVRRRRHGPPR
jgi:hypothetical protein